MIAAKRGQTKTVWSASTSLVRDAVDVMCADTKRFYSKTGSGCGSAKVEKFEKLS